ncbi:carboxypeptidase-like regulatory domain-containing protein [Aquiflexum sp.]|uniref:carboxypeptidase-like regulatory domain-containing protein n=1 Tax=Aquiflexum sp. TaxID=1872584 RepID=UPI0035939C50
MKSIFVIFFIVVSMAMSFGQSRINGYVQNNKGEGIGFATIQLLTLDSTSTLSYTISKPNGYFSMDYNESGEFIILANHMSFVKSYKSITLQANELETRLDFNLDDEIKNLDEYIIESHKSAVKINGDTTFYNLDLFLTGREETLKDILNKLPGIEVDRNGIIKSNGKTVNNLLIEGESLFGSNHKIVTDNLRGDMVGGIELIGNYQKNKVLKGIQNSDQEAINVRIKEDSKNKISGEIGITGAYYNRFDLFANLFSFRKKTQAAIITDLNNINKPILSQKDYSNFDGSIKKQLENNDLSISRSVVSAPEYLSQNDRVISRTVNFNGYSITHRLNPNFKIKSHGLTNFQKQNMDFQSLRTFVNSDQEIMSIDKSLTEEKGLFGQINIDLEYSNSDKSFFNFTNIINLSKIGYNSTIDSKLLEQSQEFVTDKTLTNYYFGHQVSYLKKIKSDLIWTNNLYFDNKRIYENLNLVSDGQIFDFPTESVGQTQREYEWEWGGVTKFTQIYKSLLIDYFAGFQLNHSSISFSPSNQDLDLSGSMGIENTRYYVGTGIKSDQKKLVKFKIGFEVGETFLKVQEVEESSRLINFLPNAQLRFDFNPLNSLITSYDRTFQVPEVAKLVQGIRIRDFRNLIDGSDIMYSDLSIVDKFSLQYLFVDVYSGTTAYIFGNYLNRDNISSTDNSFFIDYNTLTFTLGSEENRSTLAGGIETRLEFIPFIFKNSNTLVNLNSVNFIENNPNFFNTISISNTFSLRTFGLDNIPQIEFGFERRYSRTYFELMETKNQLRIVSPFGSVNGKWGNNLNYFLKYTYSDFKTNDFTNTLNVLDFQINYKKEGEKWEIGLIGNDLLNLYNSEIIEIFSNGNQFIQNSVNRIPGYLGFNIKRRL